MTHLVRNVVLPGRAVWNGAGSHNRGNKKRKANKKQQQNFESKNHVVFGAILFHGFSYNRKFLRQMQTQDVCWLVHLREPYMRRKARCRSQISIPSALKRRLDTRAAACQDRL